MIQRSILVETGRFLNHFLLPERIDFQITCFIIFLTYGNIFIYRLHR